MRERRKTMITTIAMLLIAGLSFTIGYNAGLRRAGKLLDERFPWMKGVKRGDTN